jgi:hypothetical protein
MSFVSSPLNHLAIRRLKDIKKIEIRLLMLVIRKPIPLFYSSLLRYFSLIAESNRTAK